MATITRAERIQALLFLLISVAITVAVVLVLVGLPFGKETVVYYLRFTDAVTGLDAGTAVSYKGVKCGKISDVKVNPRNPEEILVTLEVQPSTPVNVSTTAHIASRSILGPYFVNLSDSRATSPPLPPGSDIPASPSSLARLLETGETVGDQLVRVLENLENWTSGGKHEQFWGAIDEITATLTTIRKQVDTVGPEVSETLQTWNGFGARLNRVLGEHEDTLKETLDDLRNSIKRVRNFLDDGHLDSLSDSASATMGRIADEVERDGAAFREFLEKSEFGPLLERSVVAIERVARDVAATASTLEIEGLQLVRAELGPAWRELRGAAESLARALAIIERNPRSLLFGEPVPERPIPGVTR